MAETKVALLFDDAALIEPLRQALVERGATIVHEGPLAVIDAEALSGSGADVLVVNLGEDDDEAVLDRLHDMAATGRPRLLFNDTQATRGLAGWDLARWTRHLAAKVLAGTELDPPRPARAHVVEPAPTPELPVVPSPAAMPATAVDEAHQREVAAESASLAAELEALLSDPHALSAEDELAGSSRFDSHAEWPELHDGDFSAGTPHSSPLDGDAQNAGTPDPDLAVSTPATRTFDLTSLSLLPMSDGVPPVAQTEKAARPMDEEISRALAASADWSLVDDVLAPLDVDDPLNDLLPPVEKAAAADHLKPLADEAGGLPIEPGLSLERIDAVSAVAPTQAKASHEMLLDEQSISALGRVVVLGATASAEAALGDFLATLPAQVRWPVLIALRPGALPADEMALRLATRAAMPVHAVAPGMRAQRGDVLVWTTDMALKLGRDGRFEPVEGSEGTTIDAVFSRLAGAFGSDLRALVFSGNANDAIAGAQVVHDRGGQVWVEHTDDEHFADMVYGIQAEHLAAYAGTPQQLAARLTEEFP